MKTTLEYATGMQLFQKEYISKFLNICEFIDSSQSLNIKSEYLNCETVYLHHLDHEGLSNYIKDILEHSLQLLLQLTELIGNYQNLNYTFLIN